jgi:N-methylhydantoinase A
MGGTTAKLCVIEDNQPLITYRFEAARQMRFVRGSGLPIRIPTVHLMEIGAGGGSVARLDQLGLLRVGPESAASHPGPVCYGHGGERVTVTDANLIMGLLNPSRFAGGSVHLDVALARTAIAAIAGEACMEAAEFAWGIRERVNEEMASAARVHLAELGKDPRQFVMLTTGGGGPLHGCDVARKAGLREVVCPPSAGVASALGLLLAPGRADRVTAFTGTINAQTLRDADVQLDQMVAKTEEVLRDFRSNVEALTVHRFADMRYIGQGYELIVQLPDSLGGPDALASVQKAFERQYATAFGQTPQSGQIEIVNLRLSARAGDLGHSGSFAAARATELPSQSHRSVYLGKNLGFVECAVVDRRQMPPGMVLRGAALVEEDDSTLFVPPDWSATVLAGGAIHLRLEVIAGAETGVFQ